jgi:iron(III) transport system permease protein
MGALTWDLRRAVSAAAVVAVAVLCGLPLLGLGLELEALGGMVMSGWFRSGALLGRSVCLAAAAGALAMMLGVCTALAVRRLRGKLRQLLVMVLIVPLLLPSYIQALTWGNLVSGHRWLARALTADSSLMGSLMSVWVLALSYYPVVMLLVLAALGRWDQRFTWSAWANGVGPRGVRRLRARYLGLPAVTGAFVVVLLAFADFAVPDFFQVRTYATEIFIQVSSYLDTRSAMILALPVMATALLVFWALTRAAGRFALMSSYGTPVVRADDLPQHTGRPRRTVSPGLLAAWLFAALLVLTPLLNLVRMAGGGRVMIKAVAMVREDAITGFGIAFAVAFLAVLINVFAAYSFQRRTFPQASWTRMLPALLFAVPSSLVALAAIRAWNGSTVGGWAYDCGLVLLLVTTARWMPVSLEILVSGWRQLAPIQEAAADAHGIKWHRTLRGVLLPQLWPALTAAFLLTLIFAFNELTLMTLLAPPGISTLPLRLFQTVHYGPESLLAAICLWHILFLLIPVAVLLVVLPRWRGVRVGI